MSVKLFSAALAALFCAPAAIFAMPCLVTNAFAQTHLDSDAPKYDFDVAYQKNIQTALREAYADDVIVRMVGEPSFSPEYAIGLRRTARETSVFRLRLKVQVWSFQSRDHIKEDAHDCKPSKDRDCSDLQKYADAMPDNIQDIGIERCEAPISEAVASEIEDAWRLSLLAEKSDDDRVGVDGENFYFAMNDRGQRLGGKVWTPAPDTMPGKLVSLALDMGNSCDHEDEAANKKIGAEASNLVSELKEQQ